MRTCTIRCAQFALNSHPPPRVNADKRLRLSTSTAAEIFGASAHEKRLSTASLIQP